MNYINEKATHHHGDDTHTAGWAGIGMIPIAIYLYYLKSYGIRGKVLECGVFKGGSTCCLSHICDYLGLELIAADSFEGLPTDDDYYRKGDFRGSFQEVQNNIERLGKPKAVTYRKGWFSESLQNFCQDLMLIWLDVDLKQSVDDVLTNTFHCLTENGVIFCDGLGKERDFQDDHLIPASSESTGVLDYFSRHHITHKAIYSGYGHMGLIIPHTQEDEQLIYSSQLINRMIFASLPFSQQLDIVRNKIRNIRAGSD
ncbi:MAG: TylF/MycF family methyltransferase [Proteobacteria bacterium]|nr:TylF/MycF family methyltransferase [Pseudomonadota bacterium]MBU1060707.1 TylF/MycF family methyltransferase [Pseudomonadota bacterium]